MSQHASFPGLRRIIAASDLSEESDQAIQTAAAMALSSGAELHVFHCVQSPVFPYWDGLVPESTRAGWIESARTDLDWQIRRVLGDAIAPASLEIRLGEPAREISQLADSLSADLIVVGHHEPRGFFDDLLGSTADRLIRSAAVPCLIANKSVRTPLRQVLFPVDFSPVSNHSAAAGMALLADRLLAHGGEEGPTVVEILFVSAFAVSQPRPFAVEPLLAKQVETLRALLPPGSEVKILPRILSAALPVDGIRKAAERMDADMIVLGTHGFGTLGRALIGSVASAVSRTLRFPILMLPPP